MLLNDGTVVHDCVTGICLDGILSILAVQRRHECLAVLEVQGAHDETTAEIWTVALHTLLLLSSFGLARYIKIHIY